MSVPADTASITAEWLTDALRSAGVISGSEVISVTSSPLGEKEAFFGILVRLDITYSSRQDAPGSLVAKILPGVAELPGAHLRELAFYQRIASGSDLPVPRCYYSEHDPGTGAGVLLLEDLTRLDRVDFLTGATVSDIRSAVAGLAAVHSALWEDPTLDQAAWVFSLTELPFEQLWEHYPDKVEEILPNASIPHTLLKLGDLACSRMPTLIDLIESPPDTLIHRDPHVDNLLFRNTQDKPPVTIVDWQFVGRGRGATDIGYLLTSSVPIDKRRQTENQIIVDYHDHLIRAGITGYSLKDCWNDYRLSAFAKLAMTVTATVLLDNTRPHRRAWRQADLDRLVAFIEDHQPDRILS